MIRHRLFPILTLFILSCLQAYSSPADNPDLRKKISAFFLRYTTTEASIRPSSLTSCSIDDDARTIRMVVGGGFPEQQFTDAIVSSIYDSLRTLVAPYKEKNYRMVVVADGLPIEQLVPNAMRKGKKAEERLCKVAYKGEPWVKNASQPYTIKRGLENKHIALWQSHGNYYDAEKGMWKWQRPRLFCTTEDLFSQTFVIPYIIPMLENAGAVVYTPRDRDWQNHEVIVDNDNPNEEGLYMEGKAMKSRHHSVWRNSPKSAFAHLKDIYDDHDNPFTDGTALCIETVSKKEQASTATWIPDIPEEGEYAVYVSYQTLENSIDDAHYTVYHRGGMTEFKVNQQMGGGTWVYLGTFLFEKGVHESGRVVLSNLSGRNGIVTGDAVRFGSGMGNIRRGGSFYGGEVSGKPRWAEAARYSTQWAGMPSDAYHAEENTGDYRDDIFTRTQVINLMSGGSLVNPSQDGRKVPFELSVAFHTDAGFRPDDSYVGSLSIYTTDQGDGRTAAGLDRYVCRDLASAFLTNLHKDLSKYNWQVRQTWNKKYIESREPAMPACILEMLSHQNFADMQMGFDPHFKFDFARSVYKTILRFMATQYGTPFVVQPLPVRNFTATIDEKKHTVTLNWKETPDELEQTAQPTSYVVYTRIGDNDFDNGVVVSKNTFNLELKPGVIYSFKVCALNDGGKSFPSEILSAYIAKESKGKILIVNAFDRLSAPYSFNTLTEQGFDLMQDPGVQYGKFAGFCGNQITLSKEFMGSEATNGTGYSGNELEGKIIMGNTFDYPYIHGDAIAQDGSYSFTSANEVYLKEHRADLSEYSAIDVIYGVQQDVKSETMDILNTYCQQGGRVLVSGSNVFRAPSFRCPSLGVNTAVQSLTDRSSGVAGSGVDFNIYRQMNEYCYSVPSPSVLQPVGNAFAMLAYEGGAPAAVANKQDGYATISLGFPFETIQEKAQRRLLMRAMINYLME